MLTDFFIRNLDVAFMVKTTTKQGNVEISISDNGSSIPEEKLDKIFDPFFTTNDVYNKLPA